MAGCHATACDLLAWGAASGTLNGMDETQQYLSDQNLVDRADALFNAGSLTDEQWKSYEHAKANAERNKFGTLIVSSGASALRSAAGQTGRRVLLSCFDRDCFAKILKEHDGISP